MTLYYIILCAYMMYTLFTIIVSLWTEINFNNLYFNEFVPCNTSKATMFVRKKLQYYWYTFYSHSVRYPLFISGTRQVRYLIPEDSKKKELFRYKVRLPPYLTCSQCVLQWTYYTGEWMINDRYEHNLTIPFDILNLF